MGKSDIMETAEELHRKSDELRARLDGVLSETSRWPHVKGSYEYHGSVSSTHKCESFSWEKCKGTWTVCWLNPKTKRVEDLMRAPLSVRALFFRQDIIRKLAENVNLNAQGVVRELDDSLK